MWINMVFLPYIPIRLKDVMVEPVITLHGEAELMDVVKLMAEKDIGCIVVVNNDRKVCGIISERDIIKALGSKSFLENLKVKDVMSKDIMCMEEHRPIVEALRIMLANKIRHLPVVDSENKLRGIVSLRDIAGSVFMSLMTILSYVISNRT
ncbi:MAG: histidine kinase [Thermoprotei archaeon]|nr:MAG: histidine kinase [Thermoprotei archaeon]